MFGIPALVDYPSACDCFSFSFFFVFCEIRVRPVHV